MSMLSHIYKSRRFRKLKSKNGHRNLESQQNDNIPRSVGETSLKQEKLQNRSKSTKCYIHFHNFPETSVKYFYVDSHLQISQIPKIKSKKGTGTWNPSRKTTFQGQSAKRHSNKKNFKSGQNQKICYIHFHNFPESSAKHFNVVSHLQVLQIPKIKYKKGTGTWNPSRMTTFQGQSAKRHSNKKNFKIAQN